MDLKTTISRAVDTVFTKLDSLAVTASLHNQTSSSFNFATGALTTVDTTTTIKIIPFETKLGADQNLIYRVLARRSDVADGLYNTITTPDGVFRMQVVETYEALVVIEMRSE